MEKPTRKWEIEITDLNSDVYTLRTAVPVTVYQSINEPILAVYRLPGCLLFGEGVYGEEALDRLKEDIIRLYEELRTEDGHALGPMPVARKEHLTKIIKNARE